MLIEDADPADADEIFRVKHLGMPAEYLQYTVYRSPVSVTFLKELLRSPDENLCRVLKEEGRISGYTQSKTFGDQAHLDFIAVLPEAQGRMLGTELLTDLVTETRSRNLARITLDVFDDNPKALSWYSRKGFVASCQHVAAMVHLRAGTGDIFRFTDSALQTALELEASRGFGNLEGNINGLPVQVGLIDRSALRLRSYNQISQAGAIQAVANAFSGSRDEVMIINPEPGLPIKCSHTAITMELNL